MQNTVEQLADRLQKNPEVSKYQLRTSTSQQLSGGFLNTKLGGIYRPIQAHNSSTIAYRVEFTDGQASKGSLPAVTTTDDILLIIQQGKHTPSEPIEIVPKLDDVPKVQLTSNELRSKIMRDPGYVSTAVEQLQTAIISSEIEDTEGEIELSYKQTRIFNSLGADLKSEGTRYSSHISLNSRIGYSHNTRDLQDTKPMEQYSNHYQQIALALDAKPAKLKSGNYPVLFSAGTGWGILGQFLRGNLDGFKIDAGQSRFTTEDFAGKKSIAHTNFDLEYDQLVAMSTGSFNFDGEGIPGQKFALIEAGRLTEPVCDLKSARKLGYETRSLGGLKTLQTSSTKYDDFVKQNPVFLLAFEVLGLHAVNGVTGDYSLPSDNILLVRDGTIVGPVNSVLSGNFFDVLMQPSTGFVNAPHLFDSPALTFETQVTVK